MHGCSKDGKGLNYQWKTKTKFYRHNHVMCIVFSLFDLNSNLPSAFHGKAWDREEAGLYTSTHDIIVRNIYETASRIMARKTEKSLSH